MQIFFGRALFPSLIQTMQCVAGAWLCLNSMGHHVWKVIRSKSVFTRVTDSQRCCYYRWGTVQYSTAQYGTVHCCYYSLYVMTATASISGTATAAHFLIGSQDTGFGEFKVRSVMQCLV